ncbi:glutamate/gamma-aminobutyrate family transporter YjeM [Lactiplantibacillus mudanjiangensis]|uniref:Glutamate/gamma-aminobutyrate family transporter YjeM [Lactobacillus sp.] n=1 Tax=Lactiplantibacillus mudanjiangensis TaxID=1296538 RepID=A0A660DY41_9LACO|nr:glutamate/gamma-aminobutyrate family transporter YjeM [Lactiplantibacillus mudanjiangensis]VDG17908.1 glutamate/gamma-aminobutyrate family transporter YjeM [Lactobacillus sp.] [Lactiplantibacillus mudanjiangensis]VDG24335.1 glutamate/gamma-aminobutyrate family transporter YjeM [Lactobacillus sp.] [Lactiplantibacillus mudanjiangensis]VDG28321.1 glutamate/gamma-aminobutyrate family transporter YjeM [Lactobacillus sp.] [Lactiplantibacillus mudanjiangensis]
MSENNNKITLTALVMMIFTTVFGFANGTVAFYLMGYASILFYLLAAVLFFIPFALMMAEYGAAIKSDSSGMYKWLEVSVNARFAFIGTFMWFASYIIWMVSTAAKVWIPFTTTFFGSDQTQKFTFLGFNATQTIGLLSCVWMIAVTWISIKGVKGIVRITSIGGLAVTSLNAILLVISGIVLALQHGHLAQPFTHVMQSPNPSYQHPIGLMSFAVFAIFAYGGLEVLGGMVDKTKNPEKNFPRGIIISAVIITLGYALGIFFWGISTNWQAVLSNPTTNLGNISYVMMRNLGVVFGNALGLSSATSNTLGLWFARYTGLGMFLAYAGAFFTLTYSPLKTLILGTPKALWPKKFTQLNQNKMPSYAMIVQCALVIVIILIASFATTDPSAFYNVLTLMSNVSMTLPYLFLLYAFPKFKKNQSILKPFEVYKSQTWTNWISWGVFVVVLGANVFTLIQPILVDGKCQNTIWMLAGPIIFGAAGAWWYQVRSKQLTD